MSDISKKPAFPPPPGRIPNFETPESIAGQVTEFSLPFSCVATIFVLLRLYGRLFIVRAPGLDDACIVIGLLLSWAFCILGIANIPYGYGNHLWELYVPDVIMFLKVDLGGQIVYFVGTCFVKVSIILMYLRLNPDKVFRYLAWLIIAFDVAYSGISVLVAALGCTPIAGGWDITIESTCVNKKAFYYVQAVCNIVSDFCTLGLPIRMCWKLQMHRRQRILLVLMFAMGSFACIVSVIRLATMIPTLKDTDFTWFKVQVAAWCEVEINIGIVCACLPCLRPILSHHFPILLGSAQASSCTGDNSKGSSGYRLGSFSKQRQSRKLSGWGNSVEYSAKVRDGVDQDGSESARGMLKDQAQRGVARTTEYGVAYDSGDDHV